MAGNLSDVDSTKDRHQRALRAVQDRFHVTGLPPHALPLQKMVSNCARGLVFGCIGQLFLATEDDHTHPFLRAHNLIRFDTNQGVLAVIFGTKKDLAAVFLVGLDRLIRPMKEKFPQGFRQPIILVDQDLARVTLLELQKHLEPQIASWERHA